MTLQESTKEIPLKMDIEEENAKITQLIHFDNSSGKLQLLLEGGQLEEILKPVEQIPVAIFCITSRENNVLISEFLKLYLGSEESGENWIEKNIRAVGNIPKFEKSGLWIHTPIVLDTEDRKVGIIILEARAPYLDGEADAEWSHLVGLSVFLSSHIILTCKNFIQEKILADIKNSCPKLHNNDLLSLKNLYIVVQDWETLKHPHGLKGGEELLQSRLSIQERQSEPVKKVRETIVRSFRNIHCCLLPKSGQITRGDVLNFNPTYKSFMKEFIVEYFAGEKIQPKIIFEDEVLGGEIQRYLKKYVQMVNGSDTTEAIPILLPNILEEVKILQSLKSNPKPLQEELTARDLILSENEEELVQTLDRNVEENGREELLLVKGVESDVAESTDEENSGPEDKENELEQLLLLKGAESDELLESLPSNFDKAFGKLELAEDVGEDREVDGFEKIAQTYRSLMDNDISKLNVVSPEMVASISEQLIVKTWEMFQAEEHEEDFDFGGIHEKLKEEEGVYLKRSELEKRNDFLVGIANTISDNYCVNIINEDFTTTVAQLHEKKVNAKRDALEKFTTDAEITDDDLFSKYHNILEQKIDVHFEKLQEDLELKHQLKEKGNIIVEVIVSEYKEKIESKEFSSEDDLIGTHEVNMQEAQRRLLDTNTITDDEQQFPAKLLDDLLLTLNQKMDQIKDDHLMAHRQIEKTFEDSYLNAVRTYKDEIRNFQSQCEFFEENILQEKHNEENNQAVINYERSCPSNSSEIYFKYLKRLHRKLDALNGELLEQNEENRRKVIEDVQRQVKLSIAQYDERLKCAFKTTRGEEELSVLHLQEMETVIEDFRIHNANKKNRDVNSWLPYINDLCEGIQASYMEILEFCNLKWSADARISEKVLFEAKIFYNEQMTTGFSASGFMNPIKLRAMHDRIKIVTIQRCADAVATLTDFLREDVERALETAFVQYEERNFMLLPTDPAIGIDLGTTYSCVAVFNRARGQVEVITNRDSGQKTTPSYVAYCKNGKATVGEAAKEQAPDNPENTVYDAKRMIGRRFDDEDLQRDMLLWPFKIVEENESPKVEIEGKGYHPEQISARILEEMKRVAEQYLECSVKKAVITVPAYFNDSQRQATIDAGEIAGLEVLRIINEPTAAAVAYNVQYMDKDKRNVLIYDLGGGTFDVAVLEMERGNMRVKCVGGDTHLGGQDCDKNMSDWVALEFKKKTGIDLLEGKNSADVNKKANTSRMLTRLKYACERSKKIISTNRSGEDLVRIDSIMNGIDLNVKITREIFESLNMEIFRKTIDVVDQVLKEAKLSKSAVDDIVLVGGSTRIPKIQALLREYFGGKELTHKINPDEAVAFGAAIQAAIINGQIAKHSDQYTEYADVTPFSIGVQVVTGDLSVIIPKNTPVPVKMKKPHYTVRDNQTSVDIRVFQGEKRVAVENMKLGHFNLSGIPPAKAGKEEIMEEIEIDGQGVLHVTATCTSNGVTKSGLAIAEQKWRLSRQTITQLTLEHASGAAA